MTREFREPTRRHAASTLRRVLPASGRRAVRQSAWGIARATSAARLLPTFLIIGGQRCGTSSLYSYLLKHPAVGGFFSKEIYYFDRHYRRDVAWYRSHFPLQTYRLYVQHRFGIVPPIGEATPDYLFHPHAAARVWKFNPEMKLIAVLRDPVVRAQSNYHLERALGNETLPFASAIQREPERVAGELERMLEDSSYWSWKRQHFSYLARGLYKEQLERWFEYFPREQILVLRSEDLFADPAGVTTQALEFLDVPALEGLEYRIENQRDYEPMEPETNAYLTAYYDRPSRELHTLLNRDFDWSPSSLSDGAARAYCVRQAPDR